MSDLQRRMTALTGGNTASSQKLRALFGPADIGTGGSSTGRIVEADPDLKNKPGLG